jgi:hypothetical protein
LVQFLGAFKNTMSYLIFSRFCALQDEPYNIRGDTGDPRKNCRNFISDTPRLRHHHGRGGVAKQKEDHISQALSADER